MWERGADKGVNSGQEKTSVITGLKFQEKHEGNTKEEEQIEGMYFR